MDNLFANGQEYGLLSVLSILDNPILEHIAVTVHHLDLDFSILNINPHGRLCSYDIFLKLVALTFIVDSIYGTGVMIMSGHKQVYVTLHQQGQDETREMGLPIKEFFIWGDDVEYSNRLHKKYPCYVAGRSIALHDTANNEGSNIAKDDAARIGRYKFAYRNEMFIAKQNGLKGLLRQGAKICLHMARVLVHGKHKFKKWGVILGSSIRGIFFNPKIEYIEE